MENSFVQIFFREPHRLAWLIALFIGASISFAVYRSTDPPASVLQRVSMAILRVIGIAAVVFMLADPILVANYRKEIIPSVAILVDNTKSLSIADRFGSRTETVEKIIKSDEIKKLSEKYKTFWFLFADSLSNWTSPKFDGMATDLGEVISELIDTAAELEIGAAIIISDGQSNIGIDPVSVAPLSPFPLYTIGIGDPEPAPDVAVAQVFTNPTAYANEPLPVIGYIRSWRMKEKGATVSLWEGEKKLSEQNIELHKSFPFILK